MKGDFPNCWEMKKCGRENGGEAVAEHGECPSSQMDMGHSCWAVAGSYNDGAPYCPAVKEKGVKCSMCEVFKTYRRSGLQIKGDKIKDFFPEEEQKYIKLMSEFSFGTTP